MAIERRRFDPRIDSVPEARRFIRDGVARAGGDADAAELMASELAANAVIHAETPFEVRLRHEPDSVRVEIVNHAPEMVAELVVASDESGRGLTIVDRLARAWGVETGDDHKTVWFELSTGDGERACGNDS